MKVKIKQYLILISTILVSSNLAFAQNKASTNLTLQEAISITNSKSHIIKQYDYLKNQKEQELKAATALHFPKIGLSANYIYMSDDIHLDMHQIKDAIAPIYGGLSKFGVFSGVPHPKGGVLPDPMSTGVMRKKFAEGLQALNAGEWDKILQKQQFAKVSLTAQVPIYTGGKINSNRKRAKLEIEDAILDGQAKKSKLTTELVERYFGLCLAKQAEIVRQEVLDAMKKHLNDAQKMKEQGLLAQAEVLHAKVYHAQAERELKKAERISIIGNRALLNTLNDSSETSINPMSALFYIDNIEDINYFQEQAQNNNPLLKRVHSKKELAQIGVNVKTSAYLPTVAAFGTYDLWEHDLSENSPQWIVGLGLQWTVFDGLARDRHRKSAKLQLSQVNEFEQKASKDIQTAVEKYYQELQMSIEQIHELETALDFSNEYIRVKERAFHEGMSNSTEVVDARLVLAKTKIERLQAMYNYDVALAKLLELCGMSDKFIEYQTSPNAKTETFDN